MQTSLARTKMNTWAVYCSAHHGWQAQSVRQTKGVPADHHHQCQPAWHSVLHVIHCGCAPEPGIPYADPRSLATPDEPGESQDPPCQNSPFSPQLILINIRMLREIAYEGGQTLAMLPCFIFLLLTKTVASNVRQQKWTGVQITASSWMNNVWTRLVQPRSPLAFILSSLSPYLIAIFIWLGVDARKTQQNPWHFFFLC